MNIIRPTAITEAMLIASTVPEADYTAWSGATAYAVGNRCIVTAGVHKVYEYMVAHTSHYPPTSTYGSPIYWLEVSSTNRWNMFDGMVGTDTTAPAATNLLAYPDDLSNAVWSKTNCSITSAVGQSGSSIPCQVNRNAGGNHYLSELYATANNANSSFTYSVFLKAGTMTGDVRVSIIDGVGALLVQANFTPTANWQLCTVKGTFGATPAVNVVCVIDPVNDIGSAGDTFFACGNTLTQSMTVIVKPGLVNSLALVNVGAGSVTVSMTDPGAGLVYSKTITMNSSYKVTDWYHYFYEPIYSKTYLVLQDLPLYVNASITVIFDNPGKACSCGVLVAGMSRYIGSTKWSPQVSILDYSVKSKDTYGNTTLTVKSFAKLLSCDLDIETNTVDDVQRILTGYRAVPLVWVGSDEFESTVIFGFYRSFSIIISGPGYSDCSLEIEGLI